MSNAVPYYLVAQVPEVPPEVPEKTPPRQPETDPPDPDDVPVPDNPEIIPPNDPDRGIDLPPREVPPEVREPPTLPPGAPPDRLL
ncbi:MAG TPA: hypothetical protein VIP51_17340 [Eoetvoesiella sp.]